MKPATVLQRLAAYLVDVLPIVALTAGFYIVFLDFDKTLRQRARGGVNDHHARVAFLDQRNQIRDLSFVIYLLYAMAFEASPLRGTPGKRLLGIEVVSTTGDRLGVGRAIVRNAAKITSLIPCGLGMLWAIWSPEGRAWHDYAANTLVRQRPCPARPIEYDPS